MADPRPNILWISFEDTNPFYGCYGDPVARTPNVDRLAAGGGRWPNAFSTAGAWSTSRWCCTAARGSRKSSSARPSRSASAK